MWDKITHSINMKRRELCKKAAVGATGGVFAGTGTASASRADPESISSPPEVDRSSLSDHDGTVSTRGHYYVSWFNTVRRDPDVGEFEYEIEEPVPGYDSPESPEEVVVFAHGWQVDSWVAEVNFQLLAGTLAENGYDNPVVGFEWDSTTSVFDWWEAIEIAKRNGKKLGRFLADYRQQNPDTTIRLMGHSLGAQVALSTVARVDENDWFEAVDSLTLLGAAVDDEVVATDETYGPAIARRVGQADNFHSANDDILKTGYTAAEWDLALGNYGAEGTTPENYADQKVDHVTTHYNYFLVQLGCLDEVAREWGHEPDDGDGASRQITGQILTAGASKSHVYRVDDADSLEVTLEGPSDADFDLYLTLDGRTPTTADYDHRSTSDDGTESITLDGGALDETTTLGLLVSSYTGIGEYAVVVH